MKEIVNRYNKATLIAAALIITGATAIFGTYAASDELSPPKEPGPLACYEMVSNLTDEQKNKMQEANNLYKAGDTEGAKAILNELGFKPPLPRKHKMEWMKNLTEEQKAKLKEVRKLMKAGDNEGAKEILDELGIKPPMPRPWKRLEEKVEPAEVEN